jgi:hypothetical protein
MKTLFAALFVLALSGCPKPLPPPYVPTPNADAAMPAGPPSCATACARAVQLGCDWGRPTAGGAPCTTVCANANRGDGPIRFDFACRANAASCNAADLCP